MHEDCKQTFNDLRMKFRSTTSLTSDALKSGSAYRKHFSKARIRMQFYVLNSSFMLQNFTPTELHSSSPSKTFPVLKRKLQCLKTFFRLYDNQRSALIYSQQCRLRVDVFFFESSCLFIHSNSFRAYLSPKWFLIASAWLYFSGLMELTFRWVSISFSVKEK